MQLSLLSRDEMTAAGASTLSGTEGENGIAPECLNAYFLQLLPLIGGLSYCCELAYKKSCLPGGSFFLGESTHKNAAPRLGKKRAARCIILDCM
jgi:hypothetical protein